MRMKIILLPLLLLCVVLFPMAGCTTEVEYYGMEIAKIETSRQEGLAPFAGYYWRSFDFKRGKVYDTIVTEQEVSDILEYTNGFTADDFNHPKQVAAFTREQATELYEQLESLGLFTWEEAYITDETVDDGGNTNVIVYFADGTVKRTSIYFESPPHYDEIRSAFEEHLGVSFYNGW